MLSNRVRRRWYVGDTAAMACVTTSDIRNWRVRSKKWDGGTGLFDRIEDEGWQAFTLDQVGWLAVVGEAGRSGIPLELAPHMTNAGLSVAWRALQIEAGQDIPARSDGPPNGSWGQSVRYLVVGRPAEMRNDLFYCHSGDPQKFPEWAQRYASYAVIDLHRLAQRIVDNKPEKDASGRTGGLADLVIEDA